MTDCPTPPPPGLTKWHQLEHLSETERGGKQKGRRESARRKRQLEQRIAELRSTKARWKLTLHSGCAVTLIRERWQGDTGGA